jgi:hypothetical protein
MKKLKIYCVFFITFLALPFFVDGCIIFHKVSYDIKLDTPNSGTVTVTAFDLRSNAKTNEEFADDKKNLFDFMLKSNKFIQEQKKAGKNIISRKIFLKDKKLIGEGVYKFNTITAVEGIQYEDGFHYLNLAPDDSVMDTNGEVIASKGYKRIMWDNSIKELKFTMFSFSFDKEKYRELAPFYNSKQK